MSKPEKCENCKYWLDVVESPNWDGTQASDLQKANWINKKEVRTYQLPCFGQGSLGYCRKKSTRGVDTYSEDWCGRYEPKGKLPLIYADYLEEQGCPKEWTDKLREFDK